MLTLLLLFLPVAVLSAFDTDNDTENETDAAEEQSTEKAGTGDLLDEVGKPNSIPEDDTAGQRSGPQLTEDGRRLHLGDDGGNGFILSPADDVVFAKGGDDFAVGGLGDDEIFLGDGDDEGFRRFGADQTGALFGDEGDDTVRGGKGSDEIKDRQGANRLFGDGGNDILDSRDTVRSTAAPDVIDGGSGQDLLIGDDGDTVTGGSGLDLFAVAQSDDGDRPVVITDYEPGEILAIELNGDLAETVTKVQSDTGEDVEIRIDGAVIARLEGITDPDDVQITFIDNLDEQYSFNRPAGRG